MNLARQQANNTDRAGHAALISHFSRRCCPKFHGTKQELESLLGRLFNFAVYGSNHSSKGIQHPELKDWKVVEGRLTTRTRSQPTSRQPESRKRQHDTRTRARAQRWWRTPGLPSNWCQDLANVGSASETGIHFIHRVIGPMVLSDGQRTSSAVVLQEVRLWPAPHQFTTTASGWRANESGLSKES